MKDFLTGGTGFVGAHVARSLLEAGFEVRALARPSSPLDNLQNPYGRCLQPPYNLEIVRGDLNDRDLDRQMRGCHVLFHVAAHYSLWKRDRHALYQNNVLGTRNVLAAARKAKIERVVYTSSVAAIGTKEGGELADETHQSPPEKLIGHYKKSKYYAEQEARQAVKMGQDVVIVNPTTPIGNLDIKPTPTGDIILRFLRRQMPAYVNTGLNFIHVRDVAQGHLLALEKGKSGDRYILGNQNLTLKEFLEELATITGLNAPKTTLPLWLPLTVAWVEERLLAPLGKPPSVPIDGVRMAAHPMYYDPSKARKELGLPQTSLTLALKDAVNWFIEEKLSQD